MAGKSFLPKSNKMLAILLLSLLMQIMFVFIIAALDILPLKYAAVGFVLLIVINGITIMLMSSGKKCNKKPVAGLVLSIITIITMAVGIFYLYNTAETLLNISGNAEKTEQYHVVVINESKYEEVDQIAGKDVYIVKDESKMYKEAQEKLKTKVDVNLISENDVDSVSSHLVDEKGRTSDEIIFISNSSYNMLCDNDKVFKKNTRVLFSIPVAIKSDDFAKRINVTEDPFNIYISGVDTRGDISDVSRSDVNMIVTVNPVDRKILLTSMPRDSYVKLSMNDEYDKLTHSGVYGINETIATVEKWLDVDINYYYRVNFKMLISLVDAIGGVTVESPFDFKSSVSKYTYVKGENELDGKAALYFVRERKTFEDEDEERVRNQQRMVKAIIKKVTTSDVLLTNYTDILSAVESQMETNMSNKEMSAIVKMQLNDMNTRWTIKTISIDGTDAEKGTWSMGPGRPLFVSIPKEKSVEQVKKKIHEVMYPVE